MISLSTPNLCGNEAKYLQECVNSTYVSSVGPFVSRFEKMVAQAAGAQFAVATSSGTTGLHLALLSVGVRPGDLVITPSFTFIASANSISHCGATPWLFDVDAQNWTLDTKLLKNTLISDTVIEKGQVIHKSSGKRVAAIMPVHTLGTPADMDPIQEIGKTFQIPIVVDAAPALGATYKNKPLAHWGDLSVFSFNGNKTVTSGAGGVIVGNKENFLKNAHHLSTTARVDIEYNHDVVGYNYRMTNLQAAVGCAQLENLTTFVNAKRRIRKTYDNAFKDLRGVGFFPDPVWARSACWFSGLIIESEKLPSVREICLGLKDQGIEGRTFWKPVHLQKPYEKSPRTTQDFSESLWDKILTLPCSTHLTEDEQSKVIKIVRNLLTNVHQK